jgi:glycosyltransferase involved in cell wall biosynthesis
MTESASNATPISADARITADRVDIVIPTHNRALLLRRTLDSLVRMRVPAGTDVRLYVVGNACTDATADVVAEYAANFPWPVLWVEEATPGKSFALNTGIAQGEAEWVAFFDDDEVIAEDWLEAFTRAVQELTLDFVAGRYLPEYESPPPAWLPARFSHSVLAFHPEHLERQPLTLEEALFWGGNCAVRRRALEAVSGFDVRLARTAGRRALGYEDCALQTRLLLGGFQGWFLPELRIHHWTPDARMTLPYFRSWAFWGGYSGRQFEARYPARHREVVRWFGVPRWRIREAISDTLRYGRAAISRRPPHERLELELSLRQFAGSVLATWDEWRGLEVER